MPIGSACSSLTPLDVKSVAWSLSLLCVEAASGESFHDVVPGAACNCFASRIRPAGRELPTPVLYY